MAVTETSGFADSPDSLNGNIVESLGDASRLQVLLDTGLWDTPPEPAFDRITALASQLLNVPFALLSFMDSSTEFFKSVQGGKGNLPTIPLMPAMYQAVLAPDKPLFLTNTPLPVPDAVTYLGIPLVTHDGWFLGLLAVLDLFPREWSEREIVALKNLAAMVLSEIEVHRLKESMERSKIRAGALEGQYRQERDFIQGVVNNLKDVVFQTDSTGLWIYLNPAWEELTGFSVVSTLGQNFLEFVHPEDRERNQILFAPLISREKEYCRHKVRYLCRDGSFRWVEVFAQLTLDSLNNIIGTSGTLTDITERREAELRLQASEARKAAILETALDCIITMDGEGCIVDFNPAAERTFGYQAKEVLGKPLVDFIIPKPLRDAHRQGLARYFETGEGPALGQRIEVPALHREGYEFPIELAISVLHEQERPLFTAYIRDITARRQSEELLRSQSHFNEAILETVGNLVIVLDRNGRLCTFNRVCEEMTGIRAEDALGQAVWEMPFYPKEERDLSAAFWQDFKDDWEPQAYEAPLRDKEGKLRILYWTNTALRDDNGRIRYIISAGVDITERQEAEEALRRSEARLAVLIANFQAGILVEDEKRNIVLTNQQFCDLFQIPAPPEALVGMDCSQAAESSQSLFAEPEKFIERLNVLLENREIVTAEEVKMASGRVLERDYVPIHTKAGYQGLLWLYRDITQRKEAEERLQALAKELQISNRELDHFAAVASHDLQEPLRKIQMFAGRLQEEGMAHLDSNCQSYLLSILGASRRMRNLISDLLRLSRITSKARPFSSVKLSGFIREVTEDLVVRLNETGGRVEVGALPVIQADETQMRQLFQNLIGNALKFHRPGVPPLVRITGEQIEMNNELYCQITVADNGIGFEPEYNEQVFEVFERLHEPGTYEGTGIGLAICRKIVERHRGTIHTNGIPNEGATFTILLPLMQPTSNTTTQPAKI